MQAAGQIPLMATTPSLGAGGAAVPGAQMTRQVCVRNLSFAL